ncbi:PD-(D/E)XK nuclease family protein [Metabacillus iocasae]|uniref:CRISPR/Cas system-associated exonuclease Cas4 (RecB family) n=1 Tax=Priestia iocasae TaxID=2291674 RepID=A0ABS2QW64_9BACI|nr:PD-(D/E)XK nuclease family protein [Metabacillus iocasae]MBM7703721.1 CRISPR/Cas system-associated exonuclease Cas4 (RecB family) [Metabacillus iocasae]
MSDWIAHQDHTNNAKNEKDVNHLFEVKTFPDFSWSYSRHKMLMECAKRYGYHYYLSHNGWLHKSSSLAKEAYRLKKLVNLPTLFGQLVHEEIEHVIEDVFKTGVIPHAAELEHRIRLQLRKAFQQSRDQKEQWMEKPNHYQMLFEMYYHGQLVEKEIEDIHQKLNVCLKHFLLSKSFQEIIKKKDVNLFESERFRSMVVKGVRVYVIMDLMYQDEINKKWVIIDWKTGKRSTDDIGQLSLYALYLMNELEVNIEDIEIRNEYLLTGGCHTYQLTKNEIDNTVEQMETSIAYMKHYQKNEETNEPVSFEQFLETSQAFRCITCNYKELCQKAAH